MFTITLKDGTSISFLKAEDLAAYWESVELFRVLKNAKGKK